jgi:ABC-type glycerol-3-phosphate transport system permease component
MVAFGIIAVVGEWNEYLWPFLMSDDASVAPIPVGLTFLQQAEGVTHWGPVMAGNWSALRGLCCGCDFCGSLGVSC